MVTQSRELSVIGLGDPVMDVLFQVDHKFLASIANKAGGCTNITDEELKRLTCMAAEHCDPVRVPGGSAANVMKGLANISAGSVHCKFMGMVGTDAVARDYMQKLEQQNVQPVLLESCEGPTASCLCFVTPDGQRTMRTCLGASAHLTSSSMLPQGWPAGAALLHCEGYCLYRPQLAREAMREAKQAGALVSIDLASFECVANCKQPLLELLQEGLIDLVFANEEEAVALLEVVAGQQGASAGAAAAADPTYTVSGARDHYRQQSSGGFLIEKVPEHANLFSELQQYPATSFRLAANDKVPAFVDRSFHPLQRQPGQLRQQSLAQQVNGRQQYKYFRRPQLPPGARLSAPLHLTQQQQPVPEPPAQPEPAIKDAYTQSDYRESEAQTLPWSPDWVLPRDPAVLAKQAVLSAKFNCQGPKVLQLADLKFGDGLPGGLQEVQRLEKLRQKRAFEASLPPIDDAARLPERQALIEAWEAAEWAEREGEIQGVQDERLALLQAALKVREEEIEEAHRAQVEQRSAALLAAKAQKFAAIHSSRIKTIRHLAARRKAVDAAACGSSGNGGSIIDKYADFGSPVYAPLQREGRFPDAIKPSAAVSPAATAAGAGARQLPDVQSLAPSSLAGLQELQASLPSRALQPKLHRPKPPAKLNYSQRAEAAVQQDVETISNLLQSAKATQGRGVGQVWPYPIDQAALHGSCGSGVGGKLGGSRRNVDVAAALGSQGDSAAQQQQVIAGCKGGADSSKAQTTRTGERPPTPGAPPLPDADGQHAALVLLQRLLRGRAVQNEMYAGKTSRLQLIRELRLGLEGTAEEAGVAAAHQHASQEEQQSSLGGSKEEGKQQQQQQQQEPGLQQCDQQQQVLHPAGKPDPGLGLSELAEQQQHTDDVAGGPAAESSTGETAEGMVQQGSSSQQGTRSDGSASEDAVDTAAVPLGSHAADSSAERHQNSSISTGAEEAQQRQQQPQEYMGVEEDRANEVPVSSAEHESANKALDADSAIDELPPDAQHSAQSPAAAGSWAAGEQVLAEGSSDSVAVAGRAAEASLAGGVLLSGGVLGVLADASCSGSSGHGSGAVSGVESQFSLGAGVHDEEPESEDAVRTPSMLKPRGLHAMIGEEEDDEQEVTSCSSSSVDRQQQEQQQDAGMQLEASSNSSSSRSSSSSSASEEEEQ
ncbi:hypothetical protein OEZ85_002823 [Tetradesmus obliquus]|uniref:Cilia- and flagella-associated protein 91 n=1 Tax=Tetradesmus obliquus TaxID=3088 RepID=A0ABY8TYR1_TETOB|nr:hypothetical protein OEZ85_002823 [Tetradesmus obliquus]